MELACAVFERNPNEFYSAMRKRALQGDPKTFTALADRAYGKVPQTIEATVTVNIGARLDEARKRREERKRLEVEGMLLEGKIDK